jgi:hypothetical protein
MTDAGWRDFVVTGTRTSKLAVTLGRAPALTWSNSFSSAATWC